MSAIGGIDIDPEPMRLRSSKHHRADLADLTDEQWATPSLCIELTVHELATERTRQLESDNQWLRHALAEALGDHRAASRCSRLGPHQMMMACHGTLLVSPR